MIYLASDHRGMVRKEEVKKFLDETSEKYEDMGNLSFDPEDDAIGFVRAACGKIEAASAEGSGRASPETMPAAREPKGIFFCGSGVMVDMVANRFPKIRSCLAVDPDQVKAARAEDDVNVLCLGTDSFSAELAKKLVGRFLETKFSGEEKYKVRIKKLEEG